MGYVLLCSWRVLVDINIFQGSAGRRATRCVQRGGALVSGDALLLHRSLQWLGNIPAASGNGRRHGNGHRAVVVACHGLGGQKLRCLSLMNSATEIAKVAADVGLSASVQMIIVIVAILLLLSAPAALFVRDWRKRGKIDDREDQTGNVETGLIWQPLQAAEIRRFNTLSRITVLLCGLKPRQVLVSMKSGLMLGQGGLPRTFQWMLAVSSSDAPQPG